MNTEKIVQVLNDVAKNEALTGPTGAFLSSPSNAEAFAKKIAEGSSRIEFLSLPGCSDEIYTELRRLLNDTQLGPTAKIIAKRGRSGGLTILESFQTPVRPAVAPTDERDVEEKAASIDKQELSLEKEFYPVVREWAEGAGYTSCQITGGKLPGFKWENPDLIAIDHSVSRLTRSLRFYITSFEVKLRVEPYAVWQAAHYYRFSNEVYVAFAKSEDEIRSRYDGRVFNLAVELGLGVLAYEASEQCFREIQSPQTQAPEASRVDEAIENFHTLFAGALSRAGDEFDECFQVTLTSRRMT